MGVYALINISSSIIENCIVWDGIQYLETGSDYVLIEVSESIELTGSYTKPPELYGTVFDGYVSGSFTGSFMGSLQGTASYTLTASYLDILKAGTIRFDQWGLDGTINNYYKSSVSFSSSYSNNSYAISLTCGVDVRTLSIANKTVSGFEINSNSSTAMTDNVYWIAVPYNNP